MKIYEFNRDDLEEFFFEEYIKNQSETKRFSILASNPYFKKENRTADKAANEGWEIQARTSKYDFIITVLRRKYIPPIMDSFTDFILATKYITPNADDIVATKKGEPETTRGNDANNEESFHTIPINKE